MDSSGGPAAEALLREYEILREDERSAAGVTAALMSVIVAIVGGSLLLVLQACPSDVRTANCLPIPPEIYPVLPLGSLAIFMYTALHGTTSAVRSFYLQALERRILDRSRETVWVETDANRGERTPLPVPSFIHFIRPLVSQRRGWGGYRLLIFMIYVVFAVAFVGLTVISLSRTPLWLRYLAGPGYSIALAALIYEVWYAAARGRFLWVDLVKQVRATLEEPLGDIPRAVGRPLSSYLISPRIAEWVKALFPLGGAALGAISSTHGVEPWHVLLFVAALEGLAYQARYLLNDLRNITEDARHLGSLDRGRFPVFLLWEDGRATPKVDWGKTRGRVAFGALDFVIRLSSVAAIGLVVPTIRPYLWGATAGLFAVAIPYEILRSKATPDHAAGASQPVAQSVTRISVRTAAIYALVGIGYVVRVLAGLLLGASGDVPLAALIIAGIFTGSFGIMFVTMTWALESSSFVLRRDQPEDYPIGSFDARLLAKPHLAPLARQAMLIDVDSASTSDILGFYCSAAVTPVLNPAFLRHARRPGALRSTLTIWGLESRNVNRTQSHRWSDAREPVQRSGWCGNVGHLPPCPPGPSRVDAINSGSHAIRRHGCRSICDRHPRCGRRGPDSLPFMTAVPLLVVSGTYLVLRQGQLCAASAKVCHVDDPSHAREVH